MKRTPLRLALASATLTCTPLAGAHADAAESSGWTIDPLVVLPLLIAFGVFACGVLRLRQRAAAPRLGRAVLLYLAGLGVLVLALVSPLHAAGARSFAAHMAEHELLMLAAAPLLIASRPAGILLWAFPHRARHALAALFRSRAVGGAWNVLSEPTAATLLQAAALWLWHAPRLFDLALAQRGWHIAQHASFLISALLFWSAMFAQRRRRAAALVIGCLFATATISGALGALMAFSASPWYAGYRALQLGGLGLTPVQDQQIAGLLMWIPGGLVHMAFALALLAQTLREPTRTLDRARGNHVA